MNDRDQPSDPDLRRRAERQAQEEASSSRPLSLDELSADESRRLLHELRVHEIELEMQNEELRRAHEELEVSRARYFDLYDVAPVGYLRLDRQGVVLESNLTVSDLLGIERGELNGKPVTQFILPADQDTFYHHRRVLLETGRRCECELRLARADGEPVWVSVDSALGTERDGQRVWRAAISDVGARKRAEQQLVVQSAALSSTASAMVITDPAGAIEWSNPAFSDLSGYGGDEAIGMTLQELADPDVHPTGFYREVLETLVTAPVWRGEVTIRRRDGSSCVEDQTITPVRDADEGIAHFVVVERDLTEERKLQERIVQAEKMEMVGRLAGGVAHDFNNLLTVINGTADLVLGRLPAGQPLRRDLEDIREAGERAALLTRQLLAVGRQQILRREAIDLNALVERDREMLRSLLGEQLELVVTLASGVGTVRADRRQIEQALLNLVLNARDATPDGGTVTIETRSVRLGESDTKGDPTLRPGRYVMLAVSDTGVGIARPMLEKIFEPFFSTKAPGSGTGMGLAMVDGLVRQSGGSVSVESEPGAGATFTILLPSDEEPKRPDPSTQRNEPLQGTETVLIVEDELAVAHLAARILGSAGYSVLEANTGEDALRLLKTTAEPVDLLLTDVVLPGMSGPELAVEVRTLRPEIQILFTSGYTDDTALRDGVLEDRAQFLPKPYSIHDLSRKVREVLDGGEARRRS